MANYINKYTDLNSWLNDSEKDFPNVSYWITEDKINWEDSNPFRLKLFYENGDEYTMEYGEGYSQDFIATADVARGISSSSDPHYKSHIVKAIIGDYETKLGSYAGNNSVSNSDVFKDCNNLEEVVFGKNLKLIGNDCFYYCTKIFTGDLIFPDTIEKVGKSAYYNSSNINTRRKLFIPKKLTSYIQNQDSDTGNYTDCFGSTYNKTGFESIVVDPENPKYDSRENCNCLINSTSNMLLMAANYNAFLPSTVTRIDRRAFKYSDITSVDLSNVTSIGEESFRNCTNLETVTFGDNITTLPRLSFFNTKYRDINIPSQVSSIYEMNTDGVSNSSVFNSYFNIDTITVDPNNTTYDSRNNCNAIIKTDENKMIYCCLNTTIPSTVTKLGYCIFYTANNTHHLTSIDLSNITHIQKYCFNYQTQLTELNLSSIVEVDGFDYCNGIQKIDFGENVEKIEGFYFTGGTRLNTIICRATTPPNVPSSYVFSNNGSKNTVIQNIYVPDASVDLYKAATNWSRYSDLIKPLSEYIP